MKYPDSPLGSAAEVAWCFHISGRLLPSTSSAFCFPFLTRRVQGVLSAIVADECKGRGDEIAGRGGLRGDKFSSQSNFGNIASE